MYSNQKDQINLESVYNKIHSENINEQITPPDSGLAMGVVMGGMVFLASAMDYIFNKYQQFQLKGLSQKIVNKINSDSNLRKKIEELKQEADNSGNIEYTKEIKNEISKIIKSDTEFRSKVPDNQEDNVVQEILNLLPNNFAGKNNEQLKKEVINNYSNAQHQNKMRASLGVRR
jgi:uncharacterized membrane-anchored protein YjiN (DUF445 family)